MPIRESQLSVAEALGGETRLTRWVLEAPILPQRGVSSCSRSIESLADAVVDEGLIT